MSKALVLGVNGQDGSYVAESLLRRGYTVVGVARQECSRYIAAGPTFSYEQLDLGRIEALTALLRAVEPDCVFHTAAVHGSAGFQYETKFASMMAVNVLSVHAVCEYARLHRPELRIVYANSAKIFPTPLAGVIDETARIAPTCLYSIGKIAALELIHYYRLHHGIAGCNLILFNHESARRPPEFFVPTLARGLAASLSDSKHRFALKTLDFLADWSAAAELMDIAVDICERAPADDFVLASGVTIHAREAVKQIFAHRGLDFARHVDETLPPQPAQPWFQVSLDHLFKKIGRRPICGVTSVVDQMLAAISPCPANDDV